MTDSYSQPAAPVENVGRGALFSLLVIPLAIVIFAIVGGVMGLISGIAAIVVPYAAGWLYTKGAGAPLSKAGWGPYVGITAVAVILGTAVGILGGFYNSFTRVGGDGGVMGSAFWTTVRNQFANNIEDSALPIIVGLGLGAVGIASVLRGRKVNSPVVGAGPGNLAQSNMPGALGGTQPYPDSPVNQAPATPPTAPVAPPAPNQPSPGVILNGKPIDPSKQ